MDNIKNTKFKTGDNVFFLSSDGSPKKAKIKAIFNENGEDKYLLADSWSEIVSNVYYNFKDVPCMRKYNLELRDLKKEIRDCKRKWELLFSSPYKNFAKYEIHEYLYDCEGKNHNITDVKLNIENVNGKLVLEPRYEIGVCYYREKDVDTNFYKTYEDYEADKLNIKKKKLEEEKAYILRMQSCVSDLEKEIAGLEKGVLGWLVMN